MRMSVGNVGTSRPFSSRDSMAGEKPVCSASCARPMLLRSRRVRSFSAIAYGLIDSSTTAALVVFAADLFRFRCLAPVCAARGWLRNCSFTHTQIMLLDCQVLLVTTVLNGLYSKVQNQAEMLRPPLSSMGLVHLGS